MTTTAKGQSSSGAQGSEKIDVAERSCGILLLQVVVDLVVVVVMEVVARLVFG